MSGPTRIALSILFAAVLIAGAVLYVGTRGDACEEWKAKVRTKARAEYGYDDFSEAMAEQFYANERPEGC